MAEARNEMIEKVAIALQVACPDYAVDRILDDRDWRDLARAAITAHIAALSAEGLEVRRIPRHIYYSEPDGKHICPTCGGHAALNIAASPPPASGEGSR